MPNASKYIIDVANIRPGGNPIKGLYVGSSEKKYATLGNKCIYDKVLYELSIDNITNVEPNAQTVTISSYTSKRTHGNGTVDTLYINPSTKQVTANTSTASTKDTTVVVNQALTLDGTTTGTGVTVTITQIKDYPTGLTLTISPKSTIPAYGGSISSALTNYTYNVKANYKSGNNNVDVTSDVNTTITANVTGVTASSKGTTASDETVAGTITFTASYICNGKTVTSTAAVNIKQDKNEVVSYANPTFTLTPSSDQTLPASGGSITATVSNVQQVRTWSSTSTDTITPTSTTSWTAQTISCNSRGTVTGGTLTLGITTATVTANGKSTSKSYTVYQQANAVTNSDYSASNIDYWASCSIGDGLTAAGGNASVSASAGHTHKYYYLYTSTSTSGPYYTYPGDTVITAMVGNGNDRFSYNTSTKVITHSSMGTTATTDTVTIRATNSASGNYSDASKSIVNQVTNDNYSPYSYSASVSVGNGISAAGGSATVTASAGHYSYYLYTSGSYDGGGHWHTDGVSTEMTENGNNRFTYNVNTLSLSHSSMGTNVTTDYVTIKATNTTNTSATASTRPGWSNVVTSTTWGDITGTPTGSCSDIPASGGTVTATTTTPQTLAQNYKYNYTSGSQDANWSSTNVSCSVAYAGGSTATASSLGTTVKARTHVATLTVRASANGKTKDNSVYVYQQANEVIDTNYSPYGYSASVSIGDGLSAGGGSATVTASAGHYSYYLYTSGSYDSGGHWHIDGVSTAMVGNGNNRFSYSNGTITHYSMGTDVTTDTVTIRATNSASGNYSDASKSITNAITNYDYSSSNDNYYASCTIGTGLSAGGGSASVSASAGHRHVYYYLYTSQSTSGPYYSYPDDGVSTSMIVNGNNRFSYSNGTITHSSMGTDETTDTVTIRATNSASGSVGDDSKSIPNTVTYTYYSPSVTVPSNQSVSSGASSFALNVLNTHASQSYLYRYDSGSAGASSNNYGLGSSKSTWDVSSDNTGFTITTPSTSSRKISWDGNTSTSSRVATITVSCTANGKTGSSSFTITQDGKPSTPSFKVNTTFSNSSDRTLYFAIASGTSESSIIVSGSCTYGQSLTLETPYITPLGKPLYLLVKASSSGTIGMGIGSTGGLGNDARKWIDGQSGSASTAIPIPVYSYWNANGTYIDSWTSSGTYGANYYTM